MKRDPLRFIRRIFCCILFLSALTACCRTSQPLKISKVTSVPENFVSLSEMQAEYENIFQYSIYADAVIYFTDLDSRTLDTQQLNDASVLVCYQDKLSSTSVGIEVPVDETVTYIYVKSPTRENNIRMIGVS